MEKRFLRSAMTISCVCIFLVLMCAFFVEDAHAAFVAKGVTTRKEQTVAIKLSAGTCVIRIKDADSWVFGQLQTTGDNKLGTPVAGETALANLGQQKAFSVPVRKTGTYYLYLHGTNKGAEYYIDQVAPGGKLRSGVPRLGTSFADNRTVKFYRIKVPEAGILKVSVKDASYRYPGYSKIQIRKDKKVYSAEEHLLKGLGYRTTIAVKKGVYKIGVRSSSELYKITATFKKVKRTRAGSTKKEATPIARKVKVRNILTPAVSESRWYKIVIPAKTDKRKKAKITIKASNNNTNIRGGIRFTLYSRKPGKKSVKKVYTLNNSSALKKYVALKNKERTVYVKVRALKQTTGVFSIYWK